VPPASEGQALLCAADELRSDPEVVLAAVRRSGTALAYAEEERPRLRPAGRGRARLAPGRVGGLAGLRWGIFDKGDRRENDEGRVRK